MLPVAVTPMQVAILEGIVTPFIPGVVEIIDDGKKFFGSTWTQHIRRETGRDVALVRWVDIGTYSLILWVFPPGGLNGMGAYNEVHVLESHPDHFTEGVKAHMPSLNWIKTRLRPAQEQIKDVFRRMDKVRSQRHADMATNLEARDEMVEYLEKLGGMAEEVARDLRGGRIPFAVVGPESNVASDIETKMRGRVIIDQGRRSRA